MVNAAFGSDQEMREKGKFTKATCKAGNFSSFIYLTPPSYPEWPQLQHNWASLYPLHPLA